MEKLRRLERLCAPAARISARFAGEVGRAVLVAWLTGLLVG